MGTSLTGTGYALLGDMGRSSGERIGEAAPTLIRVVTGMAVGVLALVLTLDASVEEFTELVSLSDDARRERFNLSPSCMPIVSAMKAAESNSSHLTVFVDCRPSTPESSSPIEPSSWRDR
jgi:hypothetical protein